MNVQEFIRDSLIQIARAIVEVNDEFAASVPGAEANPAGALHEAKSHTNYVQVPDTHNVDFDIAVTVSRGSEKSTKGDAGFKLAVAGAGVKSESSTSASAESISRLKFQIPLKLPRPAKRQKS